MTEYDDYNSEYDDLAAEDAADRYYEQCLAAHPDCRDPDHPGCEFCWEEKGE